jgi:hypothetical protein
MTAQLRSTSAIEAATQAAIGSIIGWIVCFAVGLLDLSAAAAATLIVCLMFVLSVLRGYVIRRLYEGRRIL